MRNAISLLRVAGVKPRAVALAVAAAAVTLLSALSLTVLSGWLITRAWQMPPVLHLSVAITAVRGLGISRAVFRYIDRIVAHQLALGALSELRAKVYDALASSAATLRGQGHVYVVDDTERVTDFLVRSHIPRLVAVVVSLAALGLAAWLSPPAALVMAAALAVTGFVVPRIAARSNRRAREVEESTEFAVGLDQVLQHRVEFAAAGRAEALIGEVAEASQRVTREKLAAQRSTVAAEAIQTVATGAAALGVAAIAVATYSGNPTWLGMLLMLSLAAFESHGPLPAAARHADDVARAASRLSNLLNTQRADVAGPAVSDTVEARDLRTIYGDTVWNLRVEPGERLLVRGPSGSGKTTMLETLAGLVPAASGEATAPASTRFYAEDAWVFSTSVRENLRVGTPELDDTLATRVLSAVGFPFDLDFVLDNGADSLSAGQRRRLLLARALCSDADVLLLDEPTAHLTPDDSADLMHMLLNSPLPGPKPQRTVIVVTDEN